MQPVRAPASDAAPQKPDLNVKTPAPAKPEAKPEAKTAAKPAATVPAPAPSLASQETDHVFIPGEHYTDASDAPRFYSLHREYGYKPDPITVDDNATGALLTVAPDKSAKSDDDSTSDSDSTADSTPDANNGQKASP